MKFGGSVLRKSNRLEMPRALANFDYRLELNMSLLQEAILCKREMMALEPKGIDIEN